jgi:hypothetical protein
MPTSTGVDNLPDQATKLVELPDLQEWESRPATQIIPEKSAIASPYLGAAIKSRVTFALSGGGANLGAALRI